MAAGDKGGDAWDGEDRRSGLTLTPEEIKALTGEVKGLRTEVADEKTKRRTQKWWIVITAILSLTALIGLASARSTGNKLVNLAEDNRAVLGLVCGALDPNATANQSGQFIQVMLAQSNENRKVHGLESQSLQEFLTNNGIQTGGGNTSALAKLDFSKCPKPPTKKAGN